METEQKTERPKDEPTSRIVYLANQLMKQHPHMTREQALEEAKAADNF